MKILLICLLLAPIVYLAAKQKKWYLYLVFGFVGILPDQFAIELSASFPLLTVSRILILIMLGFWIYDKVKTREFYLPASLMIFLGVQVLISVVNLRFGIAGEIKRMFVVVFEQILFVVMIADLIKDQAEFERCIDFIILGGMALAVISIVQTVFEYDIAAVLNITEARVSGEISDRMDMVRAFGTTNALVNACYIAFLSMLILYRLEQTQKAKWYAPAFFLNIFALLCTMSRSVWLCLGAVLLALLLFRRWKLLRILVPYIPGFLLFCLVVFIINPNLWNALLATLQSTINTVLGVLPGNLQISLMNGTSSTTVTVPTQAATIASEATTIATEISENLIGEAAALPDNFGLNGTAPAYSRLVEWSAVKYMIQEGFGLFGYGYNAMLRGMIHYFYQEIGSWTVNTYVDVGLIGQAMDTGLVGLACLLAFVGNMFIVSACRKGKNDSFNFYKLTMYMIILYLLLNFLSSFLHEGAVWLFFALFYAYRRLDKKGLLAETSVLAEKQRN